MHIFPFICNETTEIGAVEPLLIGDVQTSNWAEIVDQGSFKLLFKRLNENEAQINARVDQLGVKLNARMDNVTETIQSLSAKINTTKPSDAIHADPTVVLPLLPLRDYYDVDQFNAKLADVNVLDQMVNQKNH